jgi:hypothetical protein
VELLTSSSSWEWNCWPVPVLGSGTVYRFQFLEVELINQFQFLGVELFDQFQLFGTNMDLSMSYTQVSVIKKWFDTGKFRLKKLMTCFLLFTFFGKFPTRVHSSTF